MNIQTIAAAAAIGLAISAAPAFAKNDKAPQGHDPHMSTQGMQNTNSSYSADRDKGQDRAADRMSDSGTTHTHSGNPQKGKEKKPSKK